MGAEGIRAGRRADGAGNGRGLDVADGRARATTVQHGLRPVRGRSASRHRHRRRRRREGPCGRGWEGDLRRKGSEQRARGLGRDRRRLLGHAHTPRLGVGVEGSVDHGRRTGRDDWAQRWAQRRSGGRLSVRPPRHPRGIRRERLPRPSPVLARSLDRAAASPRSGSGSRAGAGSFARAGPCSRTCAGSFACSRGFTRSHGCAGTRAGAGSDAHADCRSRAVACTFAQRCPSADCHTSTYTGATTRFLTERGY